MKDEALLIPKLLS